MTEQTTIDETTPNATTERLEAVLAELTTDQKRFLVARLECSKDKDAAKMIGVSENTVKAWKYKGAPIDEALDLMACDGIVFARHVRRRSLAKAIMVKKAGLDSNDERLRQSVATEFIEWEMGKATQRQEHSGPDGGAIAFADVSPRDTLTRRLDSIAEREQQKRDSERPDGQPDNEPAV